MCNCPEFFASVVGRLGGSPTKAPETYTNDEKARLLRYKFFYAGHSIRYMFEYTVEQVRQDIEEAFERVSNYSELISMNMGRSSSVAVNTLLSRAITPPHNTVLISEYVARSLANKVIGDEIRDLHRNRYVKMNPCMDGWALEADFIYSVQQNALVNRVHDVVFNPTRVAGAINTTYVSNRIIRFHRNAPENLTMEDIEINNWFIPEVFNQGGFDCVQVRGHRDSPLALRFVQITRQQCHLLRIYYMRICLNAFNEVLLANHKPPITEIDIIVAYPTDLIARVPNPQLEQEWTIIGHPRIPPPTINYGVIVFHRWN